MTTKELGDFGGQLLMEMGTKSAPAVSYNFPGWACISVNKEFCHGIPSNNRILQERDLINIDAQLPMSTVTCTSGDIS